jgi:NADH-quinone oxidoreductase subunit H
MWFVSALAVILFLGGWWTGLGSLDAAVADNIHGFAAQLLGFVVLSTKTGVLVFVQIWIRWTLPRLRIDQVMLTCLKYLVPISCALFLGAVIWSLALPGRVFFGTQPGLGERAVFVTGVQRGAGVRQVRFDRSAPDAERGAAANAESIAARSEGVQ